MSNYDFDMWNCLFLMRIHNNLEAFLRSSYFTSCRLQWQGWSCLNESDDENLTQDGIFSIKSVIRPNSPKFPLVSRANVSLKSFTTPLGLWLHFKRCDWHSQTMMMPLPNNRCYFLCTWSQTWKHSEWRRIRLLFWLIQFSDWFFEWTPHCHGFWKVTSNWSRTKGSETKNQPTISHRPMWWGWW